MDFLWLFLIFSLIGFPFRRKADMGFRTGYMGVVFIISFLGFRDGEILNIILGKFGVERFIDEWEICTLLLVLYFFVSFIILKRKKSFFPALREVTADFFGNIEASVAFILHIALYITGISLFISWITGLFNDDYYHRR